MAAGTSADWPRIGPQEAEALLTAPGAPFEMETVEIGGVPTRVYPAALPTLRVLFDRSRQFGERTFFVYGEERISFEAHWRAATRLGFMLAEQFGVQAGDRVAICMRNYPEWSVAAFAALAIGAVLVPLNAWGTTDDIAAQLSATGARVLFADRERIDRIEARPGTLGEAGLVAVRATSLLGTTLEALIGPTAEYGSLPDRPLPDPQVSPDDVATLFHTSGTTGAPRAIIGTHRNILTNLVNTGYRSAWAAVRRTGALPPPATPGGGKCSLLAVPLFHVTGFNAILLPALANGATLVSMYKWSPEDGARLIAKERVTTITLVPTMWLQLLAHPDRAGFNLSSIEVAGFGGAAGGAGLAARMQALLPGATIGEGYGATESSSLIAAVCGEDLLARPDCIGRIVPNLEWRLLGEDGEPSAEKGELAVRGANVSPGPWAAAGDQAGGWYATGDVVRRDTDGFFYLLDRKKDLIIRGGENIHSVEVEDALRTHPAVLDAAAYALPHPILGEEVGATVELKPGATVDAAELQSVAAERLPVHKRPSRIEIAPGSLPRNAAGKVLKAELRALARARLGAVT